LYVIQSEARGLVTYGRQGGAEYNAHYGEKVADKVLECADRC
jgi:hypothetical protein